MTMNIKRYDLKIMCVFLLTVVLLVCVYLYIKPVQKELQTSAVGCKFEADGKSVQCLVELKGTILTYRPRFWPSQYVEGFNAGAEGGIWVDGEKMNINAIPFVHNDMYSSMISSDGTCIVDREMRVFVIQLKEDEEISLIVSPANNENDAMELLRKISESPESKHFKDVFSWIFS